MKNNTTASAPATGAHSPGPFTVWHNGAGVTYINDATGREVATVTSRLNGIDNEGKAAETFANAQLLRAAPSLLAALAEAEPILLRAAKRLSRLYAQTGDGPDEGLYWDVSKLRDIARAAIARAEG